MLVLGRSLSRLNQTSRFQEADGDIRIVTEVPACALEFGRKFFYLSTLRC